MFTGIIETTGRIATVQAHESNRDFWIECNLTAQLKVDQSLAHNGVCLTIVAILGDQYRVTAVAETLAKTTLVNWKPGDFINLERALLLGSRLDGHFVQGHVDAVARCTSRESLTGSWLYHFEFPEKFAALIVEKGSICIDGVSLTVFNVGSKSFTVTIIPYTFEYANFKSIIAGTSVNIEFDILGKYFLRQQEVQMGQ